MSTTQVGAAHTVLITHLGCLQHPAMDDVLECPVCFEVYDFDAHRPLLLPVCGHTICSSCLNSGLISNCPEDRTPIGDYAVLPANILALRSIEARARAQSVDRLDLIPGVDSDVKLIRSEDVQLLEKVGEGGSGEVWRASYKHKEVPPGLVALSTDGTVMPSVRCLHARSTLCHSHHFIT